jgi:uncharacterized protein (DUF1330 family)
LADRDPDSLRVRRRLGDADEDFLRLDATKGLRLGRPRLVIPSSASANTQEEALAKGYWITFYRSISDPAALAAYAKLAGPAVVSNGGRFLARGGTVKTYEQGIAQRTIAIEFDSVERAIAAHDSPAYQEALAALGNTCERDMRIVKGVD